MKRILSLVLAMVMVLGSFSAVFAVEPTAADEAVEILMDLGVLTEDKLEQDLKRQDAVVLLSRLMGEAELAAEYPSEDLVFEDVIDPFYTGYVAWAVDNGLTKGKSATKFGFGEFLKTQDLAMFLLRALGYGEVAYDDALESAKELGLLADVEEGVTAKRGMMAVMTLNALKTNSKGTEVTLATKLGHVLPEEEVVVPAALEVEEVVANNLKSFTVVFNQAVKSAKVAVKGNTVELKLAEDKMSAVGYYTTTLAAQSTSVEFTINAATEAGLELKDFVVTKVVTDVTVPTMLGARALNAKQIELQFSEVVNLEHGYFTLLNDIKLDKSAVVAKAVPNYFENTVVLELSVALKEGTHTIEVAKVKDFANFVVPTASFDINVVEDKNAPVALSAKVISKDIIEVTFDESLKDLGTFEVNGKPVVSVTEVANTNRTVVKLTNFGGLDIGAIVEVKVSYKGQTDIMDNKVKDFVNITTKTEDDSTLPTVELTVASGNKVTLKFSKPMVLGGKLTVLNKDGKVHNAKEDIAISGLSFKADSNDTVLELAALTLGLDGVDEGNFSIKLTEMTDATIRKNPLGTTTLEFKAFDTKKPVISQHYLRTAGTVGDTPAEKAKKDTVTIYFSEAMDIATIENLSNYLVGGAPLHTVAGTAAKAVSDGKSVVITYPGIYAAMPEIKVFGVKDLAGNYGVYPSVTPPALPITGVTNAPSTAIMYGGSAKLVDEYTIELTFSTDVKLADPTLFVLHELTNVKTGFSNAVIEGTKVTLTSPVKLDQNVAYELEFKKEAVKNIYGVGLTADVAKHTLVDGINPTVAVAKKDATTIKFTFSEDVTSAGIDTTNLKVRKADGTLVADAHVTIVVYKADGITLAGVSDARIAIVTFNALAEITDVTKVKVGFPLMSGTSIKDKTGVNAFLPTDWLEVK